MRTKLLITVVVCLAVTASAAAAAFLLPSPSSQAVGSGSFGLYLSGQGTPLFQASGVEPGWQQSACLSVGPDGGDIDQIGLFGSATGPLVGSLQLTVTRGEGPDTGASHACTSFVPVKQVYSGPLTGWPAESAALVDANGAGAGVRYSYRFTLSLSETAPANSSASIAFSFGASPAAARPAAPECSDGIDNDGDGLVDGADGGCASAVDGSERQDSRAVDDLVLCGRRSISLISATKSGRRVLLHGVVAKQYRGSPVKIMTGRRVSKTVVAGSDGQFRAAVKAPSRKRYRKARYSAAVANVKSAALKLRQSLASQSIRMVGGSKTIELRGKIFVPRGKRPQPVIVQRILCGRYQRVGVAKASRNGSYRIRFSAPDAAAGLYRAETRVPVRKGSKRLKKAYARAIAISLDQLGG